MSVCLWKRKRVYVRERVCECVKERERERVRTLNPFNLLHHCIVAIRRIFMVAAKMKCNNNA